MLEKNSAQSAIEDCGPVSESSLHHSSSNKREARDADAESRVSSASESPCSETDEYPHGLMLFFIVVALLTEHLSRLSLMPSIGNVPCSTYGEPLTSIGCIGHGLFDLINSHSVLNKRQTIVATAIPRITDDFQSIDQAGRYGFAFFLTLAVFQSF